MGCQFVVLLSWMTSRKGCWSLRGAYDLLHTGCYGSENFGLGSLHDDYVGLAGATPHFYSVAPYRFYYRFVDE